MAASRGNGASSSRTAAFSAGSSFPFRATGGGGVQLFPEHHLPGRIWCGSSSDSDYSDGDEEEEEVMEEGVEAVGDGHHKGNEKKVPRERSNSQERYLSSPGFERVGMNGENGGRQSPREQQWQDSRIHSYRNEQHTLALSQGDGAGIMPKEAGGVNGYGVSGRREGGTTASYWELLRAHLSDPLTGVLMDDAMILSCGHSYGNSGLQHVYRMKACGKCGQPISEDSIRPNLALRSAVQAFKREEESMKASKKRRERLEQDKSSNHDPFSMDLSRSKGVQFPFAVSDRVMIKGNKRTPERFVGRVAVVTTQCLNGWYVVKTLDNAESVKLQYRSLAKVADGETFHCNLK